MQNLRCIICGFSLASSEDDFIECNQCGEKFPIVFGIPYFYKYQESDILSLIEIFANKDILTNDSPFNEDNLLRWNNLLKRGIIAEKHDEYINTSPEWAKPWLEDRFREFYILNQLIKDLELNGADVIDIGAGLGFDSFSLLCEKARVTALEFSPFLAKSGQKAIPGIKWIGGSASCLPFTDQSYDYIFCNASLHHMGNLKAAFHEMFRILKVGGSIITIGDSYCNGNAADIELEVFNDHVGVLNGINECIINTEVVLDIFELYKDHLDIDVIAHVSNTHLPKESYLNHQFDKNQFLRIEYFKNKKEILKYFDGLSFKITLKKPLSLNKILINKKDIVLEPLEFIKWLDKEFFWEKITQLIPERFFNLKLLSNIHGKFYLLNGMQKPLLGRPWRSAFKRLRLFYYKKKCVHFSLRTVLSDNQNISILIDGKKYFEKKISKKWQSIKIDLAGNKKSVVEFDLEDGGNEKPFFLISTINPFFLRIIPFESVYNVLKSIRKSIYKK